MRGVRMHCEQSSVGKVSERPAILPPIEGSRSTSTTSQPPSAMSSAAWMPATPPPITRARRVTGMRIGSSGVVLTHLGHDHQSYQIDGLLGGLVLVVMDPRAVLADVGHLDHVGVQPFALGRLAERA